MNCIKKAYNTDPKKVGMLCKTKIKQNVKIFYSFLTFSFSQKTTIHLMFYLISLINFCSTFMLTRVSNKLRQGQQNTGKFVECLKIDVKDIYKVIFICISKCGQEFK